LKWIELGSDRLEPKLCLIYDRAISLLAVADQLMTTGDVDPAEEEGDEESAAAVAAAAVAATTAAERRAWMTPTVALHGQWAALLTSWAQDTGSWLSSIGLGKTARLSSK